MKKKRQATSINVTSAGVNPAEDRAHRMRLYFISMSLRVVCVVSLFWVRDWWILLSAAGAIILPWFAVMVGNAVAHGGGEAPEAPTPLELGAADVAAPSAGAPAGSASTADGGAGDVIVVDVEPLRRGGDGA